MYCVQFTFHLVLGLGSEWRGDAASSHNEIHNNAPCTGAGAQLGGKYFLIIQMKIKIVWLLIKQ